MEKHYVEKLIEIFEKERKNSNIISNDKYEKEVINLFELDKLNINCLKAIRDIVVIRLSDLKFKDEENRFFYMNILYYVTSTIDSFITKTGGEV